MVKCVDCGTEYQKGSMRGETLYRGNYCEDCHRTWMDRWEEENS